jgi:hypothetical protein
MLIRLLETTGGLLVLAPATADFGALIIGIMMSGAVWTHLSTGTGSPLFTAIYIAMAAALCVLRFSDAEWLLRGLKRSELIIFSGSGYNHFICPRKRFL